jgi:hypothetical protein
MIAWPGAIYLDCMYVCMYVIYGVRLCSLHCLARRRYVYMYSIYVCIHVWYVSMCAHLHVCKYHVLHSLRDSSTPHFSPQNRPSCDALIRLRMRDSVGSGERADSGGAMDLCSMHI